MDEAARAGGPQGRRLAGDSVRASGLRLQSTTLRRSPSQRRKAVTRDRKEVTRLEGSHAPGSGSAGWGRGLGPARGVRCPGGASKGSRGLRVRLRTRAPCFPRSLAQPLLLSGPGPPTQPGPPLASHAADPASAPWWSRASQVTLARGALLLPRWPCLSSWPPPQAPVCSHRAVRRRCYLNPASPSQWLRAELGTQKGSAQRAGAFTPATRHPHPMRCPAPQGSTGLGSQG